MPAKTLCVSIRMYAVIAALFVLPCVLSCSNYSCIPHKPNQTEYHETDECENSTEPKNHNATQRMYAHLYSHLRLYFLKWYLPLVVGVGTFGTVFCLIFLFLSRLFPANMLLWLVSICVGDFLILVMEGIWMLLKVWLNYDIRDINNVACVLHTSFSNYLYYWSAYMQCLLSMQRAYSIIRPLRARGSGPNMKCLIAIWTTVSVLLIIPMLPYPLYWRVIDGDCDPPRESLFRVTTLSDFIIWSLIPLIGMTSATAIICWNIFRIRRNFQAGKMSSISQNASGNSTFTYVCPPTRSTYEHRLGGVERPRHYTMSNMSTTNPQDRIFNMLSQHALRTNLASSRGLATRFDKNLTCNEHVTPCMRPMAVVQNNQGQRHGATDNAGHVTRLLICMNVWYMISTYPLMIYLMFLNFIFKDMDRDIHKFMYYLSRSLCFLNACSNWIFYCASGRLFRQRIKQICRRFIRRLRSYSFSQSSGLNDCQMNQYNRNVSQMTRERYTAFQLNNGKQWNARKVYSAENLNLVLDNSLHKLRGRLVEQQQHEVPVNNSLNLNPKDSWLAAFSRKLFCGCQPFQCHCFCTKPLPCAVQTAPPEPELDDDEDQESISHGARFHPRTTVASEHVCECEACCTGFCCWKFWWYGFSGGLMKDESIFVDKSRGHSIGLTSSSSSSYFHSELARRHSHLRVRSNHSNHRYSSHHARPVRSDDRVCDLEPVSSGIRECKVSWGLPENKLKSNRFSMRMNDNLYGSAPSTFIDPVQGRSGMPGDVSLASGSHLTIHVPFNHNPSEFQNTNHQNTRMCYCYMSSLGKRQYHLHYCKLHQNGRQNEIDMMYCGAVPRHPLALYTLHTARSEGRILRSYDGNEDEFLSLPPASKVYERTMHQSLGHALDLSN